MGYNTEYVAEMLAEYGELIVIMDSDGYDTNPELHLHDTTFDHEENVVVIQLADGEATFNAASIETIAKHDQTTDELGI